ncbi:hypothetical protein EZV62_027487 [Acer yangbiense]|uniref:CCHC-type domain-containing protein n=1 Tax=Acer yangbiense TaxID=1000413 RepID=A0A5C7GU64_9ROSI|nr:hypothetical protein EZV62_027487 [Acer yangbiense]
MSEAEITQLYENLSLEDEDAAVHEITEDYIQDGDEDVDRCLVGKVLTGKKVNREAFKGLIEQIWNQFGQVEVELVGENTFMFHFTNKEYRNKVWNRGPWLFGKSLIVLEKPKGPGDITKLKFNQADFWVQIHDIPIMCMNQRTTKWLAEYIGEVVEIPTESRECWGKYVRVKVQVDITKPLKRWLRIKLGKYEEITMVALKYERLPDFCFACGRIGHSVRECLDEDAKRAALDGQQTKFGSWMRATPIDKSKTKSISLTTGSSSERGRSVEGSRELEGDGSLSMRSGNVAPQKSRSDSVSQVAAEKTTTSENH